MCGWTGFWEVNRKPGSNLRKLVREMADTLAHRGPDDVDVWTDEEAGLALGFRRLAIVDLSPEGRQPMHSRSGQYTIVFNGEVYNFGDLRQQLESLGHNFHGRSDTEIMLAAIEQWGLEAAVQRFVGMFAFALWERKRRCLHLVRDRLGIKPLYYGWMGKTFLCGSELKALRAHPDFHPDIDRGALTLFMRHNYVPSPYTIYKGIHQLPPGCILTVTAPETGHSSPTPYWSVKEVAEQSQMNLFTGSETEAIEELERILGEAIRLRMIADVPLGAFLSGGMDSSTVVALMQAQSRQPVKTFSIGFEEAGYNEAVYARAVAEHLKTEHTELYVTPHQAQAVIPRLPEIYDEPFADSSQIPTFLVSQLARQYVTVSLSGDGGDELFGGYNRYFSTEALRRGTAWLPAVVRPALSRCLAVVGAPLHGAPLHGAKKLRDLSEVVGASTLEALYQRSLSFWKPPSDTVIGGHEPLTAFTDPQRKAALPDFIHRMMYLDSITFLPDQILTKVDRASMAVSLEARVPLLDHRVVEFAWRLPLALKVRDGKGKWILRQVLNKFVPEALIDRPKMGFGIPIGVWLRGPLRDWAESLLDKHRLHEEGFLNSRPIQAKWAEHLSGRRNWEGHLWGVLMFQAWLQRWGSHK